MNLPQGARLLVDRTRIEGALDAMAEQINGCYGEDEVVVLAVMVGGTIPAAELVLRLNFPLTMDYVHASRYRGETTGGELHWRVKPATPLKDRHVLIVDDIFDEGPTLAAIVRWCRQEGAADVRSAVLVEKLHERKSTDMRPDFIGMPVEDAYVFGFGMDYKGGYRHLPGIYAIDG